MVARGLQRQDRVPPVLARPDARLVASAERLPKQAFAAASMLLLVGTWRGKDEVSRQRPATLARWLSGKMWRCILFTIIQAV